MTFQLCHQQVLTLLSILFLSASSLLPQISSVAPVTPTEVKAQNLSIGKVQLSWTLLLTHPDQQPLSLTVLLVNLSDTSSIEHHLSGSSNNLLLDVVPGMRYQAVIIAKNEDGEMSTLPVEFRAGPARESLTPHTSYLNKTFHTWLYGMSRLSINTTTF